MSVRIRPVALFVVAGLAGCANSATSSRAPTATDRTAVSSTVSTVEVQCVPADVDGTVTIWHSMGGPVATDLWTQYEVEFERDHNIDLEVVAFGGDRSIVDKLEATPRGEWPDLIDVSEQNTLTLLDTQQFLPPSACDESLGIDLQPLVRATYSVNGELVALPFAVSVPVLVFDAAEFRTAGIDPDAPPLTLPALLAASAALSESKASPYGLVITDGCANVVLEQFSAKRGVPEGGSNNGHDGQPVEVDFATADNVKDMTALAEGVVAGHVKYLGGSENNLDDLLELSNTTDDGGSMTVHTSGALGDVIRLLGNFPGVELGVGPLPGPGAGSLIGGNAFWLTKNSDAEQVGRAWSVLKWLYQPRQLARLALDAGYVPATRAAAEDGALLQRWQEYPQLRVAYDQVLATPVSPATAGALFGPFSARARVLYEACDKILGQGADVTATLEAASQAVNQLTSQYEAQQSGEEPSAPSSVVVPEQPSSLDVAGAVECASGAAVVGVWVAAETRPDRNSGWATYETTGPATATYAYTLPFGGRFQLHVGCGGSENDWGSTSLTMFVSGSQDFECRDDPPRRGTCLAL